MIIDTHSHYDDKAYDEDRQVLLETYSELGMYVVNAGADMRTSRNTAALTEQYPCVYGVVGVHPSETAELDDDKFEEIRQLSRYEKILAIGEVGLDYHFPEPERELQIKWFRRFIELSLEENLPIVIHSRDAAADTLSIIKEYHEKAAAEGRCLRGIIHCFAYSIEIAQQYLDMGFYLGIGGVVTFKNAKKLKEVVSQVALERLVLETDCPYLAPEPYRGQRNSSLNLPYVVREICSLKNTEYYETLNILNENAQRVYEFKVSAVNQDNQTTQQTVQE